MDNYAIVSSIAGICLIVCAFVLNMLGIALLHGAKRQRTHQNRILIHSSLADIFCSLNSIAYFIIILLGKKDNTLIVEICLLFGTCSRWPAYCFLFLLTMDRLIGVKHALKYRMILTERRILWILVFAWSSWVFGIIPLIFSNPATILGVSFKFVFPISDGIYLSFIVYAYSFTFHALVQQSKDLNRQSINTRRTYRSERRLVSMSVTIVSLFVFLVILPEVAIAISLHLSYYPGYIKAVSFVLLMLFAISIPLVYIFMQPEIRKKLRQRIATAFVSVEDRYSTSYTISTQV